MIRQRPFVLAVLGRPPPGADQIALGIELQDRRRRHATLAERRILRGADLVESPELIGRVALNDPHVIARVDRDPDGRADVLVEGVLGEPQQTRPLAKIRGGRFGILGAKS